MSMEINMETWKKTWKKFLREAICEGFKLLGMPFRLGCAVLSPIAVR
jgi:hypothetical protein